MSSPFDPVATRARMLGTELGLDWELRSVSDAAAAPLNLYRWPNVLGEIVRAHVVGLGDDPRVEQMLQLLLDTLSPVDWRGERARASSEPPGAGIDRDQALANRLFIIFNAASALGLARWLRTGAPQPELFDEAYQCASEYLELAYGKKSKWRFDTVTKVAALGCAALRFADVLALVARPQLARYHALDLAKARTTLELCHAIARHHTDGVVSQAELDELCERTLRREVVASIELTIAELAMLAYLAGMVSGGDGRGLLARITGYVSYLAKPKPQAPVKSKPVLEPLPPPPPSTPLPPIQLGSSPADAAPAGRAMLATRPAHEWKQVATLDGVRWALRVDNPHDTSALQDPRWPDVIELACEQPELITSPVLTHLVRATADGKALSVLASRSTPCPLEVAFPRTVGNWIDGAMVQVFPPLTKGNWRQALAIGALERLRAVCFDACESDKQRIARGTQPYVVAPPWFWTSPLARQLEALSVAADLHPLATWGEHFTALPRLSRVYLRVWCAQRELSWRRPLRIVIERVESRLELTLQCAVSIGALVRSDLAILFAGLTRDTVSAIDIDRLGGETTDDAATLVDHLGTDVPVRDFRSHARLAEL